MAEVARPDRRGDASRGPPLRRAAQPVMRRRASARRRETCERVRVGDEPRGARRSGYRPWGAGRPSARVLGPGTSAHLLPCGPARRSGHRSAKAARSEP